MKNRYGLRPPSNRRGALFACLLAASLPAASSVAEALEPVELTLEQALEHAFRESPAVAARRAELRQAEARLLAARTYPFNPEIELARGDRRGPGGSSTDRTLGISQEIEIAGQRGKRKGVATAALGAVRSGFEREQRLLAANVELAFTDALRTRELLGIADADVELARQLLRFSERRLEAGAGTQVELNLARATAGQAERALRLGQSAEAMARNRLAELVGLPAERGLGRVSGELEVREDELPGLEPLVSRALENRADLAALRQQTESAQREIRLSKALAIPNLRLGIFYDEEEGTDDIKSIGLALPIPLFNRNQGEVAEARAEVERLSAEGSVAALAVRREVADALASYTFARQATAALEELVVGTLEDNLALLRQALDAGKINTSDVVVFRRELVEGRRQFIEALFEAEAARIALDLATGSTPVPTTSDPETLP